MFFYPCVSYFSGLNIQAVDHPYLVVYSPTAALKGGNLASNGNVEQACGLCHDAVEDPVVSLSFLFLNKPIYFIIFYYISPFSVISYLYVEKLLMPIFVCYYFHSYSFSSLFQVTACEHIFCKGCLIDFSASLGQVSCPSCSKLLTVDLTSNKDAVVQANNKTTIKGFRSSSILNRIQLENFQTSTKIEALVCIKNLLGGICFLVSLCLACMSNSASFWLALPFTHKRAIDEWINMLEKILVVRSGALAQQLKLLPCD